MEFVTPENSKRLTAMAMFLNNKLEAGPLTAKDAALLELLIDAKETGTWPDQHVPKKYLATIRKLYSRIT